MRIALFVLCLLLPLYASALEVGDQAPDFTLQGSDGVTYTLSDFRGKKAVVVAWFPKAHTYGCTIECKSLAENGQLLKAFNVIYFMASVDPLKDNKAFAQAQKADFPLLSDPDKTVAESYDVLAAAGYSKRHTFYIGDNGKILFIDKAVKPKTSAQDMAKQLAVLGISAAK